MAGWINLYRNVKGSINQTSWVLVEYFVLNIYANWIVLTKQKVYYFLRKKQKKRKMLIFSLKKGFKSLSGQNKVNSSI